MRDFALLAIVMVLVPVCLVRPWIGALAWNWIGMMTPHKLTFGFAYSFPWAMVVGGAFLAGVALTKDRKPVPWNAQIVLMLALLGYFTMTSFFAWAQEVAWAQWNQTMKVILMAVVTTMVIYGRERIRWLLLVIALSIGYYGVKGGVWVLLTGGGERVQGPAESFLSQSNGVGLALVMVIPLLFALAREESRTWLRRSLFAAAWLSILAAIFTYSRGAMLGVAVVAPLLLLRSRQKFVALVLSVAALVAFLSFAPERLFQQAESVQSYEKDRSSMQRLMSWSVAIGVASARPLTGAGFSFESHPDQERWISYGDPELREWVRGNAFSQHSIYFQMLGDHGFVALAFFLVLLIATLLKLQSIKRRVESRPDFAWLVTYAGAIQISVIGYMISGAFLSLAYFDLSWTLFAVTAILDREYRQALASAERPPTVAASGAQGGHPSGRQSPSGSPAAIK